MILLRIILVEMKYLIIIALTWAFVAVDSLYSPGDGVIDLTQHNFQAKVIDSSDVWLVEFYAPWCGHCQALAPEWKKAAKALQGFVKVGAVDMDQHPSVGGPYNVRGFPTIKIFGANKDSPKDYNGQRTAQSIVDEALAEVRNSVRSRLGGGGGSSGGGGRGGSGGSCGGGGSGGSCGGGGGSCGGGGGGGGGGSSGEPGKDVVVLTDSNFNDLVLNSDDIWLVEFYAPWCGHCKNLAPAWADAATQLKGKVKVGALDATKHTIKAGEYGVQGFPTIKWFAGGGKTASDARDYEGGRTASDIVNFALEKFKANLPPPELVQITVQENVDKACGNSQLCIISFLPNILDCQSECRNKFLDILRTMGEKYKNHGWGWLWTEGGIQNELESALDIGGFGYPAMAAVNVRKAKYALLRGSFSETGIHEFLRALANGRGSTAPIKNAQLPPVVSSDPWDGKDGELPVEEDWDLSDVDLDEEDESQKREL